jgi:hypothetical protein
MFLPHRSLESSTYESALVETKKNDMSAEKYFAKMKTIAQELAVAGKPLDDDEIVWHVLKGLGSSYNQLIVAVRANPGTTLADLFSQVEAFDRMLPSDDIGFSSSANLARRGGGAPPPHDQDDRWRDDHPRRHDDDNRSRYEDRGRQQQQDYRDRGYRSGDRRDGGGYQGGYQGGYWVVAVMMSVPVVGMMMVGVDVIVARLLMGT